MSLVLALYCVGKGEMDEHILNVPGSEFRILFYSFFLKYFCDYALNDYSNCPAVVQVQDLQETCQICCDEKRSIAWPLIIVVIHNQPQKS